MYIICSENARGTFIKYDRKWRNEPQKYHHETKEQNKNKALNF